jgi:dienelactone hydrolase
VGSRRWLRRIAVLAGCLVVAGAILYSLGEAAKARDWLPRYTAREAVLASVSESVLEAGPAHTLVYVALADGKGVEVEGHLRVPGGGTAPRPALLILGGVRTGRRTIEFLGDTGDWLVLALDYPYRGKRSGLSRREFMAALPAMRRAMLDTVPAGRLALDYLWQRGDVDRERVVLAGGSLGALFAPALAAADERVSAAAVLFGAGDLGSLIEANLELAWPVKPVAVWVGSVIVSPVEPLKYIGRISPRPVFLLNGTDDPTMPERCSRALHDRALEPKTVGWLPVGHVDIRSTQFHRQVVSEFAAWLREIGFLATDEPEAFVPAD